MNIYNLKKKRRYVCGDYVVARYSAGRYTQSFTVIGVVTHVAWTRNGLLLYTLDGEGMPFRDEDGRRYHVQVFRRNIYGLCDDVAKITKLKLMGYC